MSTTFGQRLKAFRKNKDWTQQELADIIGVSTQAISKWETDAGMPDISQIVPLSRALNVSADILLGVIDENDTNEFEEIHQKCMEIETGNPCRWPPEPQTAERGFRLMYEYFCKHPTNPRAAKYLLDMAELYWGKFEILDEGSMLGECERFAGCIFRFDDNADMHAEARFLISMIYARVGQKDNARREISRLPFKYGDSAYFSAEVAKLGGDYKDAEAFSKQSFTYRARFIARSTRLVAYLPGKSISKQIEYEEYMLRIINAFLSGGDYLPLRQIYQKLKLLTGLVMHYISLENYSRASEFFEEMIETSQNYLTFAQGGSKGSCLMLNDDSLLEYAERDRLKCQVEMVKDCMNAAIEMCKDFRNEEIQKNVEKASKIIKNFL